MKNVGLVISLVFIVSVLSIGLGATKGPSVQYFSPSDFQKLTLSSKNILVDIRTPEEYASGHIRHAQLINLHDADFSTNIGRPDKGKTILIYCRSGHRTEAGKEDLQRQGFKKIGILKGGINAWNDANFPIEQ